MRERERKHRIEKREVKERWLECGKARVRVREREREREAG